MKSFVFLFDVVVFLIPAGLATLGGRRLARRLFGGPSDELALRRGRDT